MSMCLKSASLDAGTDVSVPTPVDASVKSKAKKTKSAVQDETGEEYTTYEPMRYIKIDTWYYVKIRVDGDNYVHVKFEMKGLKANVDDFQTDKSNGDELVKF